MKQVASKRSTGCVRRPSPKPCSTMTRPANSGPSRSRSTTGTTGTPCSTGEVFLAEMRGTEAGLMVSVTLYTTMGYGNMSCRTFEGKLATIVYAFIGIPLILSLLNDLGKMCQTWSAASPLPLPAPLRVAVPKVRHGLALPSRPQDPHHQHPPASEGGRARRSQVSQCQLKKRKGNGERRACI